MCIYVHMCICTDVREMPNLSLQPKLCKINFRDASSGKHIVLNQGTENMRDLDKRQKPIQYLDLGDCLQGGADWLIYVLCALRCQFKVDYGQSLTRGQYCFSLTSTTLQSSSIALYYPNMNNRDHLVGQSTPLVLCWSSVHNSSLPLILWELITNSLQLQKNPESFIELFNLLLLQSDLEFCLEHALFSNLDN